MCQNLTRCLSWASFETLTDSVLQVAVTLVASTSPSLAAAPACRPVTTTRTSQTTTCRHSRARKREKRPKRPRTPRTRRRLLPALERAITPDRHEAMT
ncbi:hypothetical protein VTI28DRAFT_8575 [Corynascus sepedonium]